MDIGQLSRRPNCRGHGHRLHEQPPGNDSFRGDSDHIAAFAAYAFAWLDFPGRGFFFAMVVALMVVPLQTALIPMFRAYVGIDLNGTYLGVWLFHTGFGLPLAIFLLFGYISSLPGEIIESAHIDGASPFTTFTRLSCHCRSRSLPRSPSSSSCGYGTTCWSLSYSWEQEERLWSSRPTVSSGGRKRPGLAHTLRLGPLSRCSSLDCLFLSAALLRARVDRRLREGIDCTCYLQEVHRWGVQTQVSCTAKQGNCDAVALFCRGSPLNAHGVSRSTSCVLRRIL